MERILKIPAWYIFIISNTGFVIANTTLLEGTLPIWILKIIGAIIYCIYPFAVGYVMNKRLPTGVRLHYNFYLLNSFTWFIGSSAILIFADVKETGLYTIPIIYVFFALINFIGFPAKAIKSIELNKEATLSEYVGEFFHMAFIPVGIWYLQPRIKRIMEGKEITA